MRRRCCQLKGEAKEGEGKRERKVRLSAPENKVLISNATVKSALRGWRAARPRDHEHTLRPHTPEGDIWAHPPPPAAARGWQAEVTQGLDPTLGTEWSNVRANHNSAAYKPLSVLLYRYLVSYMYFIWHAVIFDHLNNICMCLKEPSAQHL